MPGSTTPDTQRNVAATQRSTDRTAVDGDVLAALGARLAVARRRRSLTLANVAERSGVSPAHVSQIESGTANPTLRTLLQVADAVGIDAAELFGAAGLPDVSKASAFSFAAEHTRAARGAAGTTDGPVAVWDRTAEGAHLLNARMLHGTVGDHAESSVHAGEEFVVVLGGSCRLHVGALVWELAPGDSCHFDAGQPHHLSEPSADLLLSVVLSGAS